MAGSSFSVCENSCFFYNNIYSKLFPGKAFWVFFAENFYFFVVDFNIVFPSFYFFFVISVYRIVFYEINERVYFSKIVYSHYIQLFIQSYFQESSPNSSKPV